MAATCHFLSLLLIATCMALLLLPPMGPSGTLVQPKYPGDEATTEQKAQYAAELHRYINMLSGLRYGKRDQEDTLSFLKWGFPNRVAPRELGKMDV